jgi:hypothetical protein
VPVCHASFFRSPLTYEAVNVLASAAMEVAGGLRREVMKRIREIYGQTPIEVRPALDWARTVLEFR